MEPSERPLISCCRKTVIAAGRRMRGENPGGPLVPDRLKAYPKTPCHLDRNLSRELGEVLLRRDQFREPAVAHHGDVCARLNHVPVIADADPSERSLEVLDRLQGFGDLVSLDADILGACKI